MSGIVRISGTQALQHDKDLGQLAQIMDSISGLGYDIRIGSHSDRMELSGQNSVQHHIQEPDAFIFYGTPTLGELFKLVSLFVGLQTGDSNLTYVVDGERKKKPVIIFDPNFEHPNINAPSSEINDLYTLFTRVLCDLKRAGTVSQDIGSLLTIARNQNELLTALLEPKEVPPVTPHLHATDAVVDPRILRCTDQIARRYIPDKNRLSICAYTSASARQDETSKAEAYALGKFVAELKKPKAELISGMGNTGLMFQVHNGCTENGGYSSGSNCPHIIKVEGVPSNYARLWVRGDIYSRMEVMYEHSDIIVVGAGGRGGAGTFQEFLGGLLLWQNKSQIFQPNRRHIHQIETCPMIVDNRLGMFTSMIELGSRLGYKEHFRVVEGTDEVIKKFKIF